MSPEGPADPACAYMQRMWRHALDLPDNEEAFAREHHALPYMPISPEQFGLELTPRSLVVNVGCLSGYGVWDFCHRRSVAGLPVPRFLGIDNDPRSIAFGNEQASGRLRGIDVSFRLASAESIPVETGAADLLIARLVLHHTSVEEALAEFARVLRKGGQALIQPHAPGYYLTAIARNAWHPTAIAYYARPLVSRAWLGIWGRQPQLRWFKEMALEAELVTRLCAKNSMRLIWARRDARRPCMLFVRE